MQDSTAFVLLDQDFAFEIIPHYKEVGSFYSGRSE